MRSLSGWVFDELHPRQDAETAAIRAATWHQGLAVLAGVGHVWFQLGIEHGWILGIDRWNPLICKHSKTWAP